MKKYISLFFAASLALIACQKEQIAETAGISGEGVSGKIYTYEFIAGADDTKMKIGTYGSANNTQALWEESETVSAFQTSDGSNIGTAALVSEPNAQSGLFSLETMAAPGTKIRMIHPSDAEYGKGTLPKEQTNKVKDNMVFTHAYSDEITLDESSQAAFSLKHALATVLVTFKADPEGIFGGSEEKFLYDINIRSLAGLPLSGDYTVDYETGTVTPGETVYDYMTGKRGGAGLTKYSNTACFTVLPTSRESTFSITVTIGFKGETERYEIPVLYKGQFKANQVNYIDLGLISTKPEYLDNGHDYYAKWLAGEDIVVDDTEGHEFIINKTNYPTAKVLRASGFSSATPGTFTNNGLVFVDEIGGDIKIQEEASSNQSQCGSSSPVIVVGRWKDFGTQPTFWVKELRFMNNPMTFVNIGLKSMRLNNTSAGGAVFGIMSGASVPGEIRVKDCRIDARGPQYVVDIQGNSGASYKPIGYFMMDNCIVDMPQRKFDAEAGLTVNTLQYSFFFQTSTPANNTERKYIVKNSILYTSERSLWAETKGGVVVKGNRKECLVFVSGREMTGSTFEFKNNTVANFSGSYGLCYFANSKIGGFVFDDNLCFAEDATEADGSNSCYMTRNEGPCTWTTQPHILGNVGCLSNWPTKHCTYRAIHTTHKFETVQGVVEDCGYSYIVNEEQGIKYPFTVKDYTTGVMKINTGISKLLNAGARTEKKYITATAQ